MEKVHHQDKSSKNSSAKKSSKQPAVQTPEPMRALGNQAVLAGGKYSVGAPDDYYEREADRIAGRVMRMPLSSPVSPGRRGIQRQCQQCEEEEAMVQRKQIGALTNTVNTSVDTSVDQVLQEHGEPLPQSEKDFFEARFGQDLSQVRVHTSPEARQAAQVLHARAFTVGSHIAFGAGQYAPESTEGRHLLAHEITHTLQQQGHRARRKPLIQRAQVGRVHTPATGTPHFIYELDAAMSTFSQLSVHYGVGTAAIQAANPGTSATRLRHGMQINVPANDAPSTLPPLFFGIFPLAVPMILPGMVHSTATAPIDVRWNSSSGSNRVGRLPRGASIALHLFANGGALIDIGSLQNQAAGILDELRLRGIASATHVFAFVPIANMRFTGGATSASDVNLIARMIWGEQRSQGNDAMAAAAWVARNRFDTGWGFYSQIITTTQFHGLATPAQVTGLTGADLTAWTDAQRIAQDVVNGTIADPTGGAPFFGNGAAVLRQMRACATRNAAFTHGTIAGTNFHFSNGDYTSAGCTVP